MIFQHLDAVLAFAALMLAASLLVTAGTQFVVSLLGLRGANLRRSLADLFESASQDRDAMRYSKVIARRVLQQPLVSGSIFSRFGFRLQELPFVPADAAGKLRWAGSGIPFQPWLLGAAGGFLGWPVVLWAMNRLLSADFCACAAVVTRYIPVLNLCERPWLSGAFIGAIVGGLLSRWRLATSIRLGELVEVLEKLSAPAGGTLPDPAQRAMLVVAGEAQSRLHARLTPVPSHMDRIFHEAPDEGEGGVAVAVEKAVAQIPEAKADGLNYWFDRAMERASQRFTLQARVITVVLSAALVFGTHLDAIRLLQVLSSDGQVRAQLAASADGLVRQAEQLGRGREGARSAVPDVYRTAMAAVLQVTPTPAEQAKAKPRRVSHSTPVPVPDGSQLPTVSGAAANEIQISTTAPQSAGDTVQPALAASSPAAGSSAKPQEVKPAKQGSTKSSTREQEKSTAVPREDKATIEAKARASKALEARPGFASREDAVLWLRQTLDGDPALENLAASYEQEVNAELPGDADKLIDHSASIKRDLARSGFRMIPETWPGWMPSGSELPGLLIAVVFLSLGAPICYNLLKKIASLRPLPTVK